MVMFDLTSLYGGDVSPEQRMSLRRCAAGFGVRRELAGAAVLGLIAEPVVITIAVAGLTGVRFPRGFMFAAQIVYTLGVIFAYWLFYAAMFDIGALCPWCLLVTLSTTLVFATLTHVNVREDNLFLPARIQRAAARFIDADLDVLVVTIWVLSIVLTVTTRYGSALFG
ncbi:vitamin K epoxide reductase family protein [Actinoplanes sp. NPDC026623]|uniref:vitamin K epoxide reductase family protein n=1 Tax=Actinoplanes sp. NPDC026623 TaxID=3155610 RepID=UPI0033D4A3A8